MAQETLSMSLGPYFCFPHLPGIPSALVSPSPIHHCPCSIAFASVETSYQMYSPSTKRWPGMFNILECDRCGENIAHHCFISLAVVHVCRVVMNKINRGFHGAPTRPQLISQLGPNYHHNLAKCDQSWCTNWGQRHEHPTTALLFERQALPQLRYQMRFSTSSFIS
jgi:hypothetical protein